MSSTPCASASISAAVAIARRPSRSHWTAAPAMNTEPSSAYAAVRRRRGATAPSSAARRRDGTGVVAGVREQERARAVGVLGRRRARSRPGRTSPPAGRRRCPRSGSRARRSPGRSRPTTADGRPHLGQHRAAGPPPGAAARRPSRACGGRAAACAMALETSVAWTRPPVSRQIRKRVDGAERELAALGPSRPRAASSRMWRDLRAGEVGVEREPGSLADDRLVAAARSSLAERRRDPALPHDRRARPAGRSRAPRRSSSRAGW